MKIVFLGTPQPAAHILEQIVAAGHEVELVITRPDAKRGRGSALNPSPVKEAATRLGLPVAHELSALDGTTAKLGVVVAYGAIIPASRLASTPMLNVHFSLLPRWRGAAPVERCILEGDEETGVGVMTLEPSLDTGPVHLELRTRVGEKTSDELLAELTGLGAEAIVAVLNEPALLEHSTPQVGEPTYAAKLGPRDFVIAPDSACEQALRIVRLGRTRIATSSGNVKVLKARRAVSTVAPGSITSTSEGIVLGLSDGAIVLNEVRPEGSKSMAATAWWAGLRVDQVQWSAIDIPSA